MMRTVIYGLAAPLTEGQPVSYVDGYWVRLLKLVPFEALLVFALLCLLIPDRGAQLIVLAAGILLIPLLYYLVFAQALPSDKKPLTQYYVLSSVCLAVFGGAVSNIVDLLVVERFVLLVGLCIWIFFAPLLDLLLEQVTRPFYPKAV